MEGESCGFGRALRSIHAPPAFNTFRQCTFPSFIECLEEEILNRLALCPLQKLLGKAYLISGGGHRSCAARWRWASARPAGFGDNDALARVLLFQLGVACGDIGSCLSDGLTFPIGVNMNEQDIGTSRQFWLDLPDMPWLSGTNR